MSDPFGVERTFSVEVDPEFPGDGVWDCQVVNFDREGRLVEVPQLRWGTPLVIRLRVDGGTTWVGMFAAGGLGGVRDVLPCPSRNDIAVIADGLAYVVDVGHPERGATIAANQVQQVVAVEEPPLLLLVRFGDIRAIGADGNGWATDRICVDDLHIERVDADRIECICFDGAGMSTLAVDLRTGTQVDGTTLRDLGWPGT